MRVWFIHLLLSGCPVRSSAAAGRLGPATKGMDGVVSVLRMRADAPISVTRIQQALVGPGEDLPACGRL